MGDVIYMAGRRREAKVASQRSAREPVTFAFDLALPYTYLAAERVDRMFSDVRWMPVFAEALDGGAKIVDSADLEREQAQAEARARVLRVPLVWPERMPASFRAAMRIAEYAAETGRAAAFVLAAGRLAFCGGFDLDDADVLAEASAAASLPLDGALRAAGDRTIDAVLEARGRRLLAQGADRLPVLKVGRNLFCGEERLAEAAAAVRRPVAVRRVAGPAAPTAV